MVWLNANRAKGAVVALSLAAIVVLLAAIVLSSGVAEAQRGGGGRGGGGGGGKPSGISKSSAGSNSSAEKGGAPSRVADPSSPYYGSPNYGIRHGALSNFFLWSWLFHDFDDDEYEEEYIEPNLDFGGWAISGIGIVAVLFLIRALRRRFRG